MMEKRDQIEEFIHQHLEELNDNEPLEGHFDRFEAKLKANRSKTRFSWNTVWKVAAAVVFVLLASNQAFIYFSANHQGFLFPVAQTEEVSLASVSEEYEEVEFYYTNAIQVGLQQWNGFVNMGMISIEEQDMMNSELVEFEKRYKQLQEDLTANPNDERVINAMLEYYQTKLGLITMIVQKLEEINKNNNNHDLEI